MSSGEIDWVLGRVEERLAWAKDEAEILIETGGRISTEDLFEAVAARADDRAMRAQLLGAGALIPGRVLPKSDLERG